MATHPLTNFEMQKFYQNESELKGLYSRNNLPKIMDGACVINLVEYNSVETHWIAVMLIITIMVSSILTACEFIIFQEKLKVS